MVYLLMILTTAVHWKFCTICGNISTMKFIAGEVTNIFLQYIYIYIYIFMLLQIHFLGIYRIFNITNGTNLKDCQIWVQ